MLALLASPAHALSVAERWMHLQRNGMGLPLGWRHRIGEYVDLYRKLAPEVARG